MGTLEDEKPAGSSIRNGGEDTDTATVVDDKERSEKYEGTFSTKDGASTRDTARGLGVDNVDIEAQQSEIDAGELEPQRTNVTSKSRTKSMLSRLSKSKTKEKLPPPVIPVMELDKGIVGWESQHDPEMPLNFGQTRKWIIVGFLSLITFMTPFASSILAPAISHYAADLGESDNLTRASLAVTIFLLGYAVGPLFLSPLSEIYGRYVILVTASAWFCVWLIGCALAPSLNTLIFFRFMSGIGGSACQVIGGAIVADLFPVSERGRAMTVWMLGPLFGPSLAPLIGGFVAETIGWRWSSWLTFIPATLSVVALAIFSTETNHLVLIKRKTEKLRKELNRPELRSCYINPEKPILSKRRVILNGLVRPMKMLFRSAIIFSVSLYIAFAYGCLYLLFNTIPIVFQGQYHWSTGITGLVYLSLLIGYIMGVAIFSSTSDKTVVKMTKANNGVYEPEMRLPHCLWFALLLPVTFFWYGWTADKHVHYIVPIIGIVPFGMAVIGVWLPIQAYIVDAYPQHAASGLAAFSVLRCTVAAFLPLAGPQMYASLGIGWGTSLLGFIAIGLIPIPTLIYKYGKWMRQRFPLEL